MSPVPRCGPRARITSNTTTSKAPSASSRVRANAVLVIPDPTITMSVDAGRAADELSFWMGNAGIDETLGDAPV